MLHPRLSMLVPQQKVLLRTTTRALPAVAPWTTTTPTTTTATRCKSSAVPKISSSPSAALHKQKHKDTFFRSQHCTHCKPGRPGHRSFASTARAASSGGSSEHIRSYDKQYINGNWIDSTNTETTIDVFDSNTGAVAATVPDGTEEDTLAAIAAAKAALPGWSRGTSLPERMEAIQSFLGHFLQRQDEICDRLAVELGCPAGLSRTVQFGSFPFHGSTLMKLLGDDNEKAFEWEYSAGNSTVVREPIGVVGAITPWNYPLHQIALKVIPALVAGCTVVLKPSEVTPLVAYSIAEALDESGSFPEGVFNMVVGGGPECGEVLARHPDVNLVSFTGSTKAGQILVRAAAESGTMKPVRTELGGKSAALLLEDADLESVVPSFVKHVTVNTGQSCNALSRMLVPRAHYEAVLGIAEATMESEIVGPGTDPETTVGPLASRAQYDRVVSYIETGISEGARLVTGGVPSNNKYEGGGYFVAPTLFADVTNDMTIAREEIFGPVLCVIPYDDESEAVRLANETPYGLNNAVASSDVKRALGVASQLESGMVMVNSTNVDGEAPFGGYKLSGNAREWGLAGLEEFLVTKTLNVPLREYRAAVYDEHV